MPEYVWLHDEPLHQDDGDTIEQGETTSEISESVRESYPGRFALADPVSGPNSDSSGFSVVQAGAVLLFAAAIYLAWGGSR